MLWLMFSPQGNFSGFGTMHSSFVCRKRDYIDFYSKRLLQFLNGLYDGGGVAAVINGNGRRKHPRWYSGGFLWVLCK